MKMTRLANAAAAGALLCFTPAVSAAEARAGTYEEAVRCYVVFAGLQGIAQTEIAANTGRVTQSQLQEFLAGMRRMEEAGVRLGRAAGKDDATLLQDLSAMHATFSPPRMRLLEQGRFAEAMADLTTHVRMCDTLNFS